MHQCYGNGARFELVSVRVGQQRRGIELRICFDLDERFRLGFEEHIGIRFHLERLELE